MSPLRNREAMQVNSQPYDSDIKFTVTRFLYYRASLGLSNFRSLCVGGEGFVPHKLYNSGFRSFFYCSSGMAKPTQKILFNLVKPVNHVF